MERERMNPLVTLQAPGGKMEPLEEASVSMTLEEACSDLRR
jgi:hypothetical protein